MKQFYKNWDDEKAYEMFSPTKLAENIIKLAQDKR